MGRFTQSIKLYLQSWYSSVICVFRDLHKIKSEMLPDKQEPPVWVRAANAQQKGSAPRGWAHSFHQQDPHNTALPCFLLPLQFLLEIEWMSAPEVKDFGKYQGSRACRYQKATKKLTGALSNLVKGVHGRGLGWALKSLPTQSTPWFYNRALQLQPWAGGVQSNPHIHLLLPPDLERSCRFQGMGQKIRDSGLGREQFK